MSKTILAIVAGTWTHAAIKKRKSRKKPSPSSAETKVEMQDEKVDGKQIHSQSRQQYFSKMTYDNNVNPFLLGPAKLQARLTQVRNMLVESLRKFNYKKITPLVSAHLGPVYVGIANSGINEIIAPPHRGRRRKRSRSPLRDGVIPGIERVSILIKIHSLIR